ncbi:MAG: ATP-binding protein [Sandaracinaceae bacterium]
MTVPDWAEQLRRRYLRGEASQFILHGNVHDVVLHEGELYSLGDYITKVFLAKSRKTILRYDLSTGVRFSKKDVEIANLESLMLEKDRDRLFREIGILLQTTTGAAVVLDYAEMLAPAGDTSFFAESDRRTVIGLHRWSLSRKVEVSDNLVVLVTENLSELNQKLVSNPSVVTIEIPMPGAAARSQLVDRFVPHFETSWRGRLAEVTAGLKAVQIKQILQPPENEVDDPAAREGFIIGLLGSASGAVERAKKLAVLFKGKSNEEIKELIAPGAELPESIEDTGKDQILELIYKRKREIIERECFGLIEFVDPSHDFSVVGGIDGVKAELTQIAENMREGKTSRCPMGLLFTGPMGTGKTFVAEAFIAETGMTAVKFKNFRSKWVGATEANLEKILNVIKAMGQVIVIIDEGDRAFGSGGEGDGGTSSRAIARIKQFMSDTTNRGRVLFILMTNRPDKLDIDLKRAGRLDTKIPFLYPQDAQTVEAVLMAQCRKHSVATDVTFPASREVVSEPLIGYSAAELEAIVLMALDYSDDTITASNFTDAIRDYLPSRDTEMLEYMELLAVFEASNRRMLPKKYADLGVEELQERVNRLKLKVGSRR